MTTIIKVYETASSSFWLRYSTRGMLDVCCGTGGQGGLRRRSRIEKPTVKG